MTDALSTLANPSSGDDANATKNISLPPMPYIEYTIFFRLERAYLHRSMGIVAEKVASSLDPSHFDPVEHPRPARYERLALPPYWYSSAHKMAVAKKREHRKRADRMDPNTLSRTISARWREADEAVVDYCRRLATAEKKKYEERIEVASAALFVLAQTKQQAVNSVIKMQRPSNEVAPNLNGALSLQDFAFSGREQAEKVAPEVTSTGILSLQDLVSSKPKQVTDTIMPMPMPAAAALATVSKNKDRLRDSFNEAMGYGSSELQLNQESEAVLQVLRHQAVQHQMANTCGAVSPPSVESVHHQAMNICGAVSPSPVESPAPFANARDLGGVRPASPSARTYKRKFVRRVSAPPEFLARGTVPARPRAGADDVILCRAVGGGDADAFVGGDNPRGMKRRASMIDLSMQGRGPYLDTARGLNDCFEKEPGNESFIHVPNWEKEDANKLLDLLNVPQAVEPAVGSDCASEFAADEEMRSFMKDIGIEVDC